MNQRLARMDMGLFAATLLMLGFGIVLVYSSSFVLAQHKFGGADFFLSRQAVRALLAIISFTVFINIDYHVWARMSNLVYVAAVVLLVAVFVLPGSHAVNGARRWISLGFIQFQASDLARMALVLLLARTCEEAGAQIENWRELAKILSKLQSFVVS